MDEMEIVRKITHLIYAYRHDAHCDLLEKGKVRHRDIMVLDAIIKMGNQVKMSDISSYFHITAAAVSQEIKHLESKGWVTRKTFENDKRSVYVCVCEDAKKMLKKEQMKIRTRLIEFIDEIGEEDAQAFIRILEKGLAFYQQKKKEDKEKTV